MENEKIEIVKLLADNERLIRDLYAIFAKRFADHREFWERISNEEESHGKSIDLFVKGVERGAVQMDKKRFNKKAIEFYSEYMRRKIKEADDAYFPLHKDALVLALEIEKTMMEKNFFEVFETNDPELKKLLRFLTKNMGEHAERVEEEIARN